MPSIHPNARTTPAVRAEIARSTEPTGVLVSANDRGINKVQIPVDLASRIRLGLEG